MKSSIFIAALLVGSFAFAERPHNGVTGAANPNSNNNSGSQKSANCAPSQGIEFMTFNNVTALIETGGSMWQNRANSTASYIVPGDGDVSSIYAGALWMGGQDVNGQLKLAAHLFRQGHDFWAGPLEQATNLGNFNPINQIPGAQPLTRPHGGAEIGPQRCLDYDKFFTIRKSDVVSYVTAWTLADQGLPYELDAEILNVITNWPAHPYEDGSGLGQDHYLAPFFDKNANGQYNPGLGSDQGEYPWYDLSKDIDCADDRRTTLYGDITNWWVFNDKGNIHGETTADPIGMEVRAQAFAFATADAINNMTFYNYELINRSTQRLKDTYFAQYVDADLGTSVDDFVGCDVTRGLGFCYNGDAFDESSTSSPGYGANPPAVGIDFFEGPYQDNDNKDNVGPVRDTSGLLIYSPSVDEALADDGIVYEGIGIGYGDSIIDNERFGMRRFVYFNNDETNHGNPSSASDYYNYMTGYWQNGQRMTYGGNGDEGNPIACDYMFPGDSDTLNWGTGGQNPGFDWDEVQAGNPSGDRRFVQAAGPFTLEPGAVNNITVGVVWARSVETDLLASVRELKRADSKAQALFDACFRIVEPPQAPVLNIQELENELVMYLTNPLGSNNYNEAYTERDKINIPFADKDGNPYDQLYRFEGYQIYQMVDEEASVSEIGDLAKARLVAQCDIENTHEQLVNWELDEASQVLFPEIMTFPNEGDNVRLNDGIRHSFKVTKDLFAQGDDQLVNHRTYYFLAIAYGVNSFAEFNPATGESEGQKVPYLRSRLNAFGGSITSVPVIPHNPTPEADGTFQLASYGDGPEITRIEGTGNGGKEVNLTQASIDNIVANDVMDNPTYVGGQGPIVVKVVDPLNVKPGHFVFRMAENTNQTEVNQGLMKWSIDRYDEAGGTLIETVDSDTTIDIAREQLLVDWGISVELVQESYTCLADAASCAPDTRLSTPIISSVTYADSSLIWLNGLTDTDNDNPTNWIASGTNSVEDENCDLTNGLDYDPCSYRDNSSDPDELFETMANGWVAPFKQLNNTPITGACIAANSFFSSPNTSQTKSSMDRLTSVDIVITSDKSKWTRSNVIEMGLNANWTQGGAEYLTLRSSASVDKQGLKAGESGYNASEGNLTSANGMGWFPGYAVDIQTGERLNIVFGENSTQPIGRDMIWNPGSETFDAAGKPVFGGMHTVYVFRTGKASDETSSGDDLLPNYSDRGAAINSALETASNASYLNLWKMCSWVYRPMAFAFNAFEFLATDVTIKMRITEDYNKMTIDNSNAGFPKYEFTIKNQATITSSEDRLVEAMEMINVVPNPYYGYSQYETGRIDTRIKVVNLPERAKVQIFNTRGKLVRSFDKDDVLTSLDWDLKNSKGIPIAGGVYLIHVEVPGIGEKVLKWFGGLREPDLENL
jgi:hypothetical protein